MDGLKTIPENSIDLVVTSPPYNVGKDYGVYKDNREYEEYIDWMMKVIDECFRVLKEGARICLNINDTGRNPYTPIHCDLVARMRKKWYLMGIVVWNKGNWLSSTAWGSWLSPSAPSLRGIQEYIIVAGKNGKHFPKEKKGDITRAEFLEYTYEIWTFVPESNRDHPAPFPEELPKRCLKLLSYPEDTVLDPFLGSGTTMKVSQDLGRNCIGIENNPDYCEMTRKRCFGKQFLDRRNEYFFKKV